MTSQSSFMIMAPVQAGKIDELRALLASMNKLPGHADPDNHIVPFGRFDRLHFARFTIIEAKTAEEIREFDVTPRPWQPALAFFGDIDGDRDSFIAALAKHSGAGLGEIFSLCEGFSQNKTDLPRWMEEHNVQPAAYYVNFMGRTVKQVQEEAALHKSLSGCLQEIVDSVGRENTLALRDELLAHVETEKRAGRLTLTPPEPTPVDLKLRDMVHKIGVPLIVLLILVFLSPLLPIIVPLYLLRLRMLERRDPELFIRPDRQHIRDMSAQEDHYATNQYNVFGDVKPGYFRLYTFKVLLIVVSYVARHLYNRGFLARIRTIHFARWDFMNDNHRVFFASNYAGSHESYMDDFINKLAYRELPFKYTQRRHQLRSEVWHKAYPDLTVTDLVRNSRIRQGVESRDFSEAKIRQWLSLI